MDNQLHGVFNQAPDLSHPYPLSYIDKSGQPAMSTSATDEWHNISVPGTGGTFERNQITEIDDQQLSQVCTNSFTVGSHNKNSTYFVTVYPSESGTPPQNSAFKRHETTARAPSPGPSLQNDMNELTARLSSILGESSSGSNYTSQRDSNIPNSRKRTLQFTTDGPKRSRAPSLISKASGGSTRTITGATTYSLELDLYLRKMEQKELELPKSLPDYMRIYTKAISPNIEGSKRAICLWSPDPNQNLSPKLQEKHCTLGDVGMFDCYGNFEVFFNIFMSKEENIQMHYRPPETFHPLEVSVYEYTKPVFEDDTQFSTDDFRRSKVEDNKIGQFSYMFESIKKPGHPGGAILALPDGYTKRTILSGVLHDIRLYLQQNVDSWYATTNHWNSGDNLPNGGLKLITSCYKSSIWGAGVLLRDKYRPAIPIAKMERLSSKDTYKWNAGDTPIRINHGSTKRNTMQIPYTVAVEVCSVHRNLGRPKSNVFNSVISTKTNSSKISIRERMTKSFANSWSRLSLSSQSRLSINRI